LKTIVGGKVEPHQARTSVTRDSAAEGDMIAQAGRPFSITLLAVGVFLMAGLHLIRFYQALKQWDFLAGLPGVSPLYLALTGLVWFLVGFGVGLALLRGYRFAPYAVMGLALAFTIYSWVDRALIAHESPDAWPFLVIVNVILLVWVILALRRKGARQYFQRPL
jgi:hypothetical protein